MTQQAVTSAAQDVSSIAATVPPLVSEFLDLSSQLGLDNIRQSLIRQARLTTLPPLKHCWCHQALMCGHVKDGCWAAQRSKTVVGRCSAPSALISAAPYMCPLGHEIPGSGVLQSPRSAKSWPPPS
jgi:hypothetical protein